MAKLWVLLSQEPLAVTVKAVKRSIVRIQIGHQLGHAVKKSAATIWSFQPQMSESQDLRHES